MTTIDNTYIRKLKMINDYYSLDWGRAIRDYYNAYPSQVITTIDDLPRLSMKQIIGMLAAEKEYDRGVKQFQEQILRHQYDQELSKLVGIIPGSRTPLFPWFFHECNATSVQYAEFQIAMGQLNDLFRDQYLTDFPVVERVMMQPHRPHYYRGERKFYGESKPTIFRQTPDKLGDMLVVNLLKIEEAATMLDTIPAIRMWNADARVNYIGLCQHYGLDTNMLDVTSDLLTALFFACCKWNGTAWEPMTEEDISSCGDGILHIATKEIFDMEMTLDCSEKMIVVPVGHQPLLRCSKQHGYMGISTQPGEIIDLYSDKHFTTYRFERDEEYCKWVFAECGQGDLIYPHEDNPQLIAYFEQLKRSREIPADILEQWWRSMSGDPGQISVVTEVLVREGYSVRKPGERFITAEGKEEINGQVQDEIDGRNLNPGMRPFFTEEDIKEALRTGILPDNYKG